ncbi:MAG: cation diffusion facilitator family transporter [Halobacteriaceae archaeon]
MASSKSVVIAALIANAVIAILKFIGYLLTLSPAMLSETYHSISDTGNQLFLLLGIRYGGKEATREHPFGYGKAQFFYSFLVSVLLFGIAGWESAKHGYTALTKGVHHAAMRPEIFGVSFPAVWVNYGVLIGAILFEGWALSKANAAMQRQIDRHNWSGLVEAFRKTSDVTTLTAFTEDTIAMLGAAIALVGVFLTNVTGNPLYDAVAALIIGLLLMSFAVALAWENKRLLLGESLPRSEEITLKQIILDRDGVVDIIDFRSVYFGPERIIIAADVSFESNLDTDEIDSRITAIEDAIVEQNGSVRKVYIEPETHRYDPST